jgi:hypothetical protein
MGHGIGGEPQPADDTQLSGVNVLGDNEGAFRKRQE